MDSYLSKKKKKITWTTALGKILTMIVVEWCCACKDGELVGHLLLYCDIVRELWTLVLWLLRCSELCLVG